MSVTFSPAVGEADGAWIGVRIEPRTPVASAAELWVAVAEDNVVSQVLRGENANRQLRHAGVVRHLVRVDDVAASQGTDEPVTATEYVTLDRRWNRVRLRAVALLQVPASRHVIGAGGASLR
jgi:hypothetical protein